MCCAGGDVSVVISMYSRLQEQGAAGNQVGNVVCLLTPVPQPSSVMVRGGGVDEGEGCDGAVRRPRVRREGMRRSSMAWRMLLSVS